jgi:hypothetical protein
MHPGPATIIFEKLHTPRARGVARAVAPRAKVGGMSRL